MKCSHFSTSAAAQLVLLLLMLSSRTPRVASVNCNPYELGPCAGAISPPAAPSALCCAKLKEQQPCLCQYMRNPKLKSLINPAAGRRIAAACRMSYPQC